MSAARMAASLRSTASAGIGAASLGRDYSWTLGGGNSTARSDAASAQRHLWPSRVTRYASADGHPEPTTNKTGGLRRQGAWREREDMRQSATRAAANRPKRPPKKIKRTSPTKAKRSSPKKV